MSVALVLLDLQRGIVQSDRVAWEPPQRPAAALAAAAELLDGARSAGVPVIHVGVVRPQRRGAFDALRTAAADRLGRAPRDVLALAPDTDDVGFVLPVLPGEEVVHKVGVSAFQGTRLDTLLRHADVRDVVIAGAFTHMVVESTARQGFDLGYRMVVVPQACCAPAAAPHDAALAFGIPAFARIEGVADAIARFAAAGARGA